MILSMFTPHYVLPSNVISLDPIDSASAYLTFRPVGQDYLVSAIVSGFHANKLNLGHPITVHTPIPTLHDTFCNVKRTHITSYDAAPGPFGVYVYVMVGRRAYFDEKINDVMPAIGNMMTYDSLYKNDWM